MYYEQIPYLPPTHYARLFSSTPGTVLLNSNTQANDILNAFSFLAIDPFHQLIAKNAKIVLDHTLLTDTSPWKTLKALLSAYKTNNSETNFPFPFTGGVAGFFSYELAWYLENLPPCTSDDIDSPDMALGFYDLVIVFDHTKEEAYIFSSGFPEKNTQRKAKRAMLRLKWLKKQLATVSQYNLSVSSQLIKSQICSNFSEYAYKNAVERILKYIVAGDVYQVNFTQRFSAELIDNFHPFDLYLRLQKHNPSPFSAFINLGNMQIVSASPERFIKLSNREIETCPIKGTRRRDQNPLIDEGLRNDLRTSLKDRAENIMIVDLLRNDLSKVSEHFSVKTTELCQLESYPTVHHLVSVVTGKLLPDKDRVDLLTAVYPGGSITGAPKIRAMEIINELETVRRGPYCGAIGYLDFGGNMDTSIVIRTFLIKDQQIYFSAGGGIVADSDPHEEYQESLLKANALMQVLDSHHERNYSIIA